MIASGDSFAVRFRECVQHPIFRFGNGSSLSYGFDSISPCVNDDAISAGMLSSETDGASRPSLGSYDQGLNKKLLKQEHKIESTYLRGHWIDMRGDSRVKGFYDA